MAENVWTQKVEERIPGVEFFGPKDERNPMIGPWYVCQGPTTEFTFSPISFEHAAALFLSAYYEDLEARAAAIEMLRETRQAKP